MRWATRASASSAVSTAGVSVNRLFGYPVLEEQWRNSGNEPGVSDKGGRDDAAKANVCSCGALFGSPSQQFPSCSAEFCHKGKRRGYLAPSSYRYVRAGRQDICCSPAHRHAHLHAGWACVGPAGVSADEPVQRIRSRWIRGHLRQLRSRRDKPPPDVPRASLRDARSLKLRDQAWRYRPLPSLCLHGFLLERTNMQMAARIREKNEARRPPPIGTAYEF
jgi:hypothetical protein